MQIVFYWILLLLQRMFTGLTHLASPKKIIGLKTEDCQELRKTGDANGTIIVCA